MYKYKVRMDTQNEVLRFSNIANKIKGKIELVGKDNDSTCRINAKSIIGSLYAMTWADIWLEADSNIYADFKDFIIE